jgi:hypothetical protein
MLVIEERVVLQKLNSAVKLIQRTTTEAPPGTPLRERGGSSEHTSLLQLSRETIERCQKNECRLRRCDTSFM